jgi:nicotinate-nucleotide pyrophosphorylase (carboxylating)
MLNLRKWKKHIQLWLDEDLMEGDLTEALIPKQKIGQAWITAKADGLIAGLPIATLVFQELDPQIQVTCMTEDGKEVKRGDVLLKLEGPMSSLLAGERLALNLLQRLSGIATMTQRYVENVKGLPVRIVDTRKTTPGLRGLEKYAVRMGGGHNHRFGLYDAAMIKDNHIKAAGGITQAVTKLRQTIPHTVKIEVEVESIEQVKEALDVESDIIMLDNMSNDLMSEAVALIGGRAIVEASGGVSLETVRAIAETGVDIISVGALTHSVTALDISMDLGERKASQHREG